jgi:hypothetical protein
MEPAELMEVSFYTDTNPEFVHDIVFTGSDKPLLRKKQHEAATHSDDLQVTLVEAYTKVSQYGSHSNAAPLKVWEMIVMDGSFALFKIVLNSTIQDVPHEDWHPGCTMIIQRADYKTFETRELAMV